MARKERELTVEEKEIERKVNTKLDEMPSYKRVRKTGWLGAGILAAGIAAGGVIGNTVGTNNGVQSGTQSERDRIVSGGILLPETREKLTGEKNLVVNVKGLTAEGLRKINIPVPEFPVVFPAGDGNPETTASSHSFLVVRLEGIYLPREEDDTASDLKGDITNANRAAGKLDNSLGFADGTYSDFLEAEASAMLTTGESIFQPGMFVAMSHTIEIDGVETGFAIGKNTLEEPITIITFDASSDAPLPPNISAGGFVVAK